MNLYKRSCSVFLLFVLLFAQFSTLCYASETVTSSVYQYDNNDYGVMPLDFTDDTPAEGGLKCEFSMFYTSSLNYGTMFATTTFNSIGASDTASASSTHAANSALATVFKNPNNYNIGALMRFRMADGSKFIGDGTSFDVQMTGIRLSSSELSPPGSGTNYVAQAIVDNLAGITARYYGYGEEEYVENFIYEPSQSDAPVSNYLTANGYDLTIEVPFDNVEFDVYRIDLCLYYPPTVYPVTQFPNSMSATFGYGFYEGNFQLQEQDLTSGLLASIIEWLRSILNAIVNVGEYIQALPSRIWSFIESGLKTLFVPSEQDIVTISDQWDTLLSDRFGAVYESGTLIIDTVKTITVQAGNPNIEFPQVSYNFSGTEFSFGGYTVQVVPTGFEFFADVLKTVIDIVVTLAFVNGMRNKYDELMMR